VGRLRRGEILPYPEFYVQDEELGTSKPLYPKTHRAHELPVSINKPYALRCGWTDESEKAHMDEQVVNGKSSSEDYRRLRVYAGEHET